MVVVNLRLVFIWLKIVIDMFLGFGKFMFFYIFYYKCKYRIRCID